MDDFCESSIWNSSFTWNTNHPDFTKCFQETVLVWPPCVYLWLMAGLDFLFTRPSSSKRTPTMIHLSIINVGHLSLTSILFLLHLTALLFLLRGDKETSVYPVDIIAHGILSVTLSLAFVLHLSNKKKGKRASGVLFFFWALLAFCWTFKFQSTVRHWSSLKEHEYLHFQAHITLWSYPLLVLELIFSCFADPGLALLKEEEPSAILNIPSPEHKYSVPNRLLFVWVWPLMWHGYKKPLEAQDLWDLKAENTCSSCAASFYRYWTPKWEKCQQWNAKAKDTMAQNYFGETDPKQSKNYQKKTVSIVGSCFKANWYMFLTGGVEKFAYDILTFVSPLILSLLIKHKTSTDEPEWIGYLYAILLFTVAMCQTLILGQYYHTMFVVGMNIRSALINAVYQKSLVISHVVRKEYTTGEIVNLMSVDTNKIFEISAYAHLIWSAPFLICGAIYLLYVVMGPSVLAGVGVLVLIVPLNILISRRTKLLQTQQMEFKDQRVRLMSEVLSGIKVLKLYAWEPTFENKLNDIRQKELNILRRTAILNTLSVFLWFMAPFLVSMVTFATYVLSDSDNILTARKAFVAFALINSMRTPMNILPNILIIIIEGIVSKKRLNKFLNAEEMNPNAVITQLETADDETSISIENGNFSWDDTPILKNINMSVKTGDLVAVVGQVGSGKSSLLSSMLGEMRKTSGIVRISGTLAYVSQQAWIQNKTVRDNIIFGNPYDSDRYRKILDACALLPDLRILPGGDKTEIGEKGINLSGGQNQRISIARAVYDDADIYLFDDPLSAVDSHVGKLIFEKVLGPEGLLRAKTRIIVTHGLSHIQVMSQILVLSEGEIREKGTYQELVENKGQFAEILSHHVHNSDGDSKFGSASETATEEAITSVPSQYKNQDSDVIITEHSNASLMYLKDFQSITSVNRLIEEEKAEVGNVDRAVIVYYAKSVGWFMTLLALLFYTFYSGVSLYTSIWLAKWSTDHRASGHGQENRRKRNFYVTIYGILGICQAITFFVGNLAIFLGCMKASVILHRRLLWNILRCPMSFFDTTPTGRIVNRFAKEIDVVDSSFPTNLRSWLSSFFHVMTVLVVISYSTPWFLVIVLPLGMSYIVIERFYTTSSRQLKRLDSISKSPVYSHFSETLSGTSTIRAFKKQKHFVAMIERIVDFNHIVYYASLMANRWLAIRLETVGNLIILSSALLAVAPGTNEGSVGLSVSNALNIILTLNWLVRMAAEVETNLVAVERIKEYTEVPQEKPWEIPQEKPSETWPPKGQIDFANYKLRYRPGLRLAIHGISCRLHPQEKIGVVGRTGAGKSSLTMGLFRIIEAASGSITIDDIDIARIGLHDVRRKLTIIPQDPVLFSGSLRFNMDPLEKHSDLDVWATLQSAHLESFVRALPDGLDHVINEGGENLSVGQRQLVCLARALLRKTKILVMDEATAALDLETDDLIQETVRKEFKDCTILTIAHRLNTIMDYDRVMVLERGKIVEFASPKQLLQNQFLFSEMARDAGLL